MENLIYVLSSEAEDNTFKNLIRGFFAGIIKFLYKLFSSAIDLMYDLAKFDFGFDDYIDSMFEKLFYILIIFMIFKLTISILNYIINPDNFNDSNKGFQKIISRVIISIILLISINPIFEFLNDMQAEIINSDFITSLLGDDNYGETIEFTNGLYAYGVRMNDDCDEGKYVYTFSQGDHISLLLLKPFIQPYSREEINTSTTNYYDEYTIPLINGRDANDFSSNNTNYCGIVWNEDYNQIDYVEGSDAKIALRTAIPGPNSPEGFMYKSYYNDLVGEGSADKNYYLYDFNFFFAIIAGFVALLIVVSFCFDVVIRACTLLLLKMISPIPIISYISPQGKTSEMLGNWLKKLGSVWGSLFVRIAVLDVAINFIGIVCSKLGSSDSSLTMQMFIILGILMFAKKLPKLLEELIPGLKLDGGFELNPLKRISKDALGGNAVLGAGAGAIGLGLAGATNFGHRTGSFIKNKGWQGENGNFSLRKTAGGLGKIVGSTMAGQARAGINAFGRTSKDGKLFAGAWGGYQTSMFSKLQREDNLRKAGLEDASLFEKAKFTAGSALADASRYAGVLNKGQREYLNAARQDEIIKNMEERKAQEKYERLEPLQTYSKHAQRIKERIENSKAVKDAQTELDDALASGNLDVIEKARKKLDLKKAEVSRELFKNDAEIKDLTNRMSEIRKQNVELQAESYNFQKADGTFDSSSIYNTASLANTIELDIENKAIYNVERYKRGDATVVAEVNKEYNNGVDLGNYIENHSENSIAKLQNSSRMNKDIQQPGFKPSSGPVQQKAFDNYAGGHPGNGNPQGGGIPNGNPRGGGRPH